MSRKRRSSEQCEIYIENQYVRYLEENCTCAKSACDCDCPCMSLEEFEAQHWKDLDDWLELVYEDEILEKCNF